MYVDHSCLSVGEYISIAFFRFCTLFPFAWLATYNRSASTIDDLVNAESKILDQKL